MSRAERRATVERVNPVLPVSQQCRLLAVSRSAVYRKPAEVNAADLAMMALIDRQYLARPYYGSRRMAAWLATQGHVVNRKRVRRLMRLLGLVAIYPRPNTSKPAAAHKIYPYLPRWDRDRAGQSGMVLGRYLHPDGQRLPLLGGHHGLGEPSGARRGDCPTRSVLILLRVDALEEALARYGRPEIFNTDQGSQFTSDDFTGTLKRHGVMISMDGKGRCMDNIFVERLWRSLKYEEVYLNGLRERCQGQGWDWRLAQLLQRRTPASEPWLPHAAAESIRKAYGYVDDRTSPTGCASPLPEQARKAGKCSPSPTYPQAPQPMKDLILMKLNR